MDSSTKTYRGLADGTVLVSTATEGEGGTEAARPTRPLDPRLDLIRHSPGGFAWSYRGSGPAQLALALACDVLGDDGTAMQLHQGFKDRFVALLPEGPWGPVSEDDLRSHLAAVAAEEHEPACGRGTADHAGDDDQHEALQVPRTEA